MELQKSEMKTSVIFILLFCSLFCLTCSVEFNRKHTGVVYSAYVNQPKNADPVPGWKNYTINDIAAMLEVVATKFSKVATYGAGADDVPYERNKTYHHASNKQAYAAEAAALINRERNSTVITIIIGIWQPKPMIPWPRQLDTEAQVAFESAEIANNIYPGSAHGIVLSGDAIHSNYAKANQTLECLRKFRKQASSLGLKLGVRQKCFGRSKDKSAEMQNSLFRKILKESDFIICDVHPPNVRTTSYSPSEAFEIVKRELIGLKTELTKVKPSIILMGETFWRSRGLNEWENRKNLRVYWKLVDEWATANNFTMWMMEAFDNPWKNWQPELAHLGWWKLKENESLMMEDLTGGKSSKVGNTETTMWTYIVTGVVSSVLFSLVTLVLILFIRVRTLQKMLTKDEVQQFMEGFTDFEAAGEEAVFESVLKIPYDKSYEISKKCLKIRMDEVLGIGQFGYVCKAFFEKDARIEVAVKMARSDCSKHALKSLLSEIKILAYLGKHPNIVSMMGAYTAELTKGVVYVATELCPLGSLKNFLRTRQNSIVSDTDTHTQYTNSAMYYKFLGNKVGLSARSEITVLDMIKWSHEIACGMEYLSCKHIVHGDLASRNILLNAAKVAKITDFGLSRRLYDYTNYVKRQHEPLPWRWMSIESLKRMEFSSKSDVWSYGITLWEIFSMGDQPYPGLSWKVDFVDTLISGMRMKCPKYADAEIYQIMVDCWHLDSNQRPNFANLKVITSRIMTSI